MTKKNQNFHRWYPWPKMTKKNKNFHRWYPCPKMFKNQKLSLLLSLAKSDQDKTKTFTVVILGQK